MSDIVVRVEDLKKEYRLGAIGGGTLRGDIQSLMARIRGKEDPNLKIGQGGKGAFAHERFMALNGVSFDVHRGDTLGIIGHNGAGKSTLLKLLSRVTAPSEGTIKLNGRIASMLEVGTGFHPELTGRENVYLNGAILGMSRAEVRRKFDEIVSFAEMEKFIDTPVKRYSSGMYVKLAFAVAAHLDSEIMIMDEVLAVGDMKFQEKCLGKMGDVAEKDGKTVLYVSHNMNTVRQLCNRCIVLDRGMVKYDGNVDDAIGLYMDNVSNFQSYVDFSNMQRSSERAKSNIELKYLRVIDRENNIIDEEDSSVRVVVGYSAEGNENNVYFRFEIAYADGSMAGTCFSEESVSFKKDETGEVTMDVSLKSLTPGKYKTALLAYEVNSFGTERVLDRVAPAFAFEIRRNEGHGSLEWLHKHWGHIRLPEVKIFKG